MSQFASEGRPSSATSSLATGSEPSSSISRLRAYLLVLVGAPSAAREVERALAAEQPLFATPLYLLRGLLCALEGDAPRGVAMLHEAALKPELGPVARPLLDLWAAALGGSSRPALAHAKREDATGLIAKLLAGVRAEQAVLNDAERIDRQTWALVACFVGVLRERRGETEAALAAYREVLAVRGLLWDHANWHSVVWATRRVASACQPPLR